MKSTGYRMKNLPLVVRPVEIGLRSSSITTLFGKINIISLLAAICFCFALFGVAPEARAQTTGSGSIQGGVTDSTGALIPNAAVTLVEASTNVTLKTKTSSGGAYAFPNINVGTYSVTVTAPGFQTYTSTGNVLEVGSSIAINAKLTVGSTDVKVEVHTDSMALQTEDASFKQTVDSTELIGLPLNGRHMTDLISLVGGTQNAGVGTRQEANFPPSPQPFLLRAHKATRSLTVSMAVTTMTTWAAAMVRCHSPMRSVNSA